jgi:ubiquinone/menaquinone biosynthesis C-methylase UbiE
LRQPSHNDLILDQFTRQATPFSTASPITDAAALKLIVETSGAKATDTVLDVACGGGVVACAFAPRVKHVTGIDMTPAMLARGAEYAKELGLTNLTWQQGDVTSLPYKAGAFSIVFTRFSFHHFPDPLTALKEMVRVCAVGGRVVVCDMYASADPVKAATWNRLEKLRDSKANRIETMKGPAESRQICSVGRRKIAKKIAKNKRCYANTLRPCSRMLLQVMKGG